MRKILYIVGLATLILFNATAVSASNDIYYTNREGIEMTEEEYNNLINQGFTEMQIYRMDETTFEDNKDIQATLVSEEKKHIRTTTVIRNGIITHYNTIIGEDELQQGNGMVHFQQPTYGINSYGTFYDGMVYDSEKEVDIRIAILDDDFARFKIDTYWDYIPSNRYRDISSIYFDGSKLQISSGLIHRQDYITIWGGYGDIEVYQVKDETNSGTVTFELPSGPLSSLESYMYFNVYKRPTAGTITTMVATGDYAHAFSSSTDLGVINYINMTPYGLVISSPYGSYYEDMSEVSAVFIGEW